MALTWLIILFLILVNGLYVTAEFAAVAVRQSRIRELADGGSAVAARLLPVIQSPRALDRYIACCQIGITLSSLILGAYAQATLAVALAPGFEHWGGLTRIAAESTAAVLVLVGLTVLQVVLGELVPKSLALQYPTRAAVYTALPMRWSLRLFAWFIAVLNGSGLFLLKLLGMTASAHRHIHSPEEIELLVTESRDGGLLEPEEHHRLHQALRLGRRSARQLMVPRVHIRGIEFGASAEEILRTFMKSPYTRLPVYRRWIDDVVGVINTKAVVADYATTGTVRPLKDLLQPVVTVPRSVSAVQVLRTLREQRAHLAIVVDEFGSVEGLVTLQDVLEEVLGEVADEFKTPAHVEHLPDGRVRVPGSMRLHEAEPWLSAPTKKGAETVGGWVLDVLGHLPTPGEHVTIDGVTIEVERLDRRAVASVLVTLLPPPLESRHG